MNGGTLAIIHQTGVTGGGGISIHYTYFMFSTDAATHFHRIHNAGNLTRLMTPLLQKHWRPSQNIWISTSLTHKIHRYVMYIKTNKQKSGPTFLESLPLERFGISVTMFQDLFATLINFCDWQGKS